MITLKGFHGDVVLEPLTELPEGCKPSPKRVVGSIKRADIILAEGEVTGHAHRIQCDNGEAELYERNGVLYLKVLEVVTITHEEHRPTVIAPGVYKQGFQREWDYAEKAHRSVMD